MKPDLLFYCVCGTRIEFDTHLVSYGKDRTRAQRLVLRHNARNEGDFRQRVKAQCVCGESYQILFKRRKDQ